MAASSLASARAKLQAAKTSSATSGAESSQQAADDRQTGQSGEAAQQTQSVEPSRPAKGLAEGELLIQGCGNTFASYGLHWKALQVDPLKHLQASQKPASQAGLLQTASPAPRPAAWPGPHWRTASQVYVHPHSAP